MLHLLGHLLVSALNNHITRFWARKRPSDLPSVFAPCCTRPAAAGPDDNADGKTEDEDDAPAVSGFASVVGAGAGGGWKNSTDNMGGAHGGVSHGADDNAMPGFNGSGNGSGGGGGSENGNGLMANAGVRRNCPSMSSAAVVDGRVAGSKLMTGPIGKVEATVEAVGLPALHLRYGTIEYTVSVPLTLQSGLGRY